MCLYVGMGWRMGHKTRKSRVKERRGGEEGRGLPESREEAAGVEWVGDGGEEGRRNKTKFV